jgi:hypothetical protein
MSLFELLEREEDAGRRRNFRRRVKARPASDEVVSYTVESSFPRSFQQRRRCRDWSPRAADPRVAVCPFGDELAS